MINAALLWHRTFGTLQLNGVAIGGGHALRYHYVRRGYELCCNRPERIIVQTRIIQVLEILFIFSI
jgi:hypothetical protein